jgi:hypothetical protein
MQQEIVTVTLIFIHDMFQLYTAIIRCPNYAEPLILAAHNAQHVQGNGPTTKET